MPFRVLISKRAVIVELLFRSEIKWLDEIGPLILRRSRKKINCRLAPTLGSALVWFLIR